MAASHLRVSALEWPRANLRYDLSKLKVVDLIRKVVLQRGPAFKSHRSLKHASEKKNSCLLLLCFRPLLATISCWITEEHLESSETVLKPWLNAWTRTFSKCNEINWFRVNERKDLKDRKVFVYNKASLRFILLFFTTRDVALTLFASRKEALLLLFLRGAN